jgi:hypothetical protein
VSEPEPTNCERCGKAVLAGTVEELWKMQLDAEEVAEEDARVMHRHKITLIQVKLSTLGETRVTMSRMYYPDASGDWLNLLPHLCTVTRGGRIDRLGERYAYATGDASAQHAHAAD